MRVFLVMLVCTGCLEAGEVPCGTLSCPSTDVCTAELTCVSALQLDACTGIADGARCTFGDSVGFCHLAACVVSLGICGDGVSQISENELCDCGSSDLLAAPPVGCTGFNSDDPGATCRPDCEPSRCGDGVLDPDETCDDGNTIPFDGCRADCQGRFQQMRTPTFGGLYSVLAFGPTDAYAVGGAVIHYDGVSWSNVELPTTADFSVIAANAADDIYLGGTTQTSAVLLHGDGTTWTSIPPPTYGVGPLYATSPTNIYMIVNAAGDYALVHFDGHTWTAPNYGPCTAGGEPSTISGTSASNIYIGTGFGLCHWSGSQWSLIDPDSVTILPVSGAATSVIGFKPGTQTFWRWTGATGAAWTTAPSYTVSIFVGSGPFATPDELFIIGAEGLVLDFDGTQWTSLTSPTPATLRAIAGTSPTNVFLVGDNGTVLH